MTRTRWFIAGLPSVLLFGIGCSDRAADPGANAGSESADPTTGGPDPSTGAAGTGDPSANSSNPVATTGAGGDPVADAPTHARGCSDNATCASGVCTNGECERCKNDAECGADHVCGTGVCSPPCAAQTDCGSGQDCCSGHCVDPARDILHCGGCSTACDGTQYCSATGCVVATIANACGNSTTTLIQDGYPSDDQANAVMQGGLVANCVPAPIASAVAKGAPGPINPTTGRPVAGGGNLLTVAGGAYVQKVVDYLDKAGATPVYLFANAATKSWQYLKRVPSGGELVAEMPYADFSPTHDIVLIESVRDPTSGTLILIAFGQGAESTAAAARYVAHQMLPNRTTFDKSWYVYEWIGASGTEPTENYVLKISGP